MQQVRLLYGKLGVCKLFLRQTGKESWKNRHQTCFQHRQGIAPAAWGPEGTTLVIAPTAAPPQSPHGGSLFPGTLA